MFRVVFWDILPCKMIVDRRFRGAYYEHHTRRRENLKSHKIIAVYCKNNMKLINALYGQNAEFIITISGSIVLVRTLAASQRWFRNLIDIC
jgi:hypothetical protein